MAEGFGYGNELDDVEPPLTTFNFGDNSVATQSPFRIPISFSTRARARDTMSAKKWIEKYRGKFDAGWDKLVNKLFPAKSS
jgi:hypothetical protein